MSNAAKDRSGGQRRSSAKARVVVLFGGQSDEHDVSLRSAQTVIDALDRDRYDVIPVGITREGRWLASGDPMARLTAVSPMFGLPDGPQEPPPVAEETPLATIPVEVTGAADVVFPVLHGPMGEDGTVQGLLELAGIPYVGAGVLGSALAMDKALTKTVLAQAGLPQLEWRLVPRRRWDAEPAVVSAWLEDEIGFPCFTKPANMGSSVGISKVHDAAELPAAMDLAAHFDRRVIVERGVDGRELEVAILGNDNPIASVAGEIVPSNEFYDYNAKYIDDGSRLIVPAELDGEELAYLQELAIQAFRALDLAGMARVDFFRERTTDRLFINEINTLPGFTSISMYPMLWEATGIPLPELVDRLIALALERAAERRSGGGVGTYNM